MQVRRARTFERGRLRPIGKRGGPEGWGPRRVGEGGAQIFALFFPFPPPVFILFSLSWWSFRGILVVFEAPGCSNVHVWSSLVVV